MTRRQLENRSYERDSEEAERAAERVRELKRARAEGGDAAVLACLPVQEFFAEVVEAYGRRLGGER